MDEIQTGEFARNICYFTTFSWPPWEYRDFSVYSFLKYASENFVSKKFAVLFVLSNACIKIQSKYWLIIQV